MPYVPTTYVQPFLDMPKTLWLLFLLAASVIWVWQFVQLMSLAESQFPGRFDKLLWSVAFLLTFILGAIAFWIWDRKRTGGSINPFANREDGGEVD
jgi:hypothetical protein